MKKKISFTLYHGRLIISVENNKCLKIQGSGVQVSNLEFNLKFQEILILFII